MIEILPSILAADFARLGEQIACVERGGASIIHVDIMDGHFVPNLTMGPPVVESIRKVTKSKLDVHLMITDPDRYAPLFIEAGADHVLVHQEVCPHLDRTLRMIQSEGALAGVVINPSTPTLVAGRRPGRGGLRACHERESRFRRPEVYSQCVTQGEGAGAAAERVRIERFKSKSTAALRLDNVADVVRAGCDWIVTGSSIFHTPDPEFTFREMQRVAREALLVHI
jgi:ribulose-phosphate 3-epimerase